MFCPTYAHDDVDFDDMFLYLSSKFLKNYLCLVEITALRFPHKQYKFLKMHNLDNGVFFNGKDKIACLRRGIDIYFIDKFFWNDADNHDIYIFLLDAEKENINNYEDINNIINSKQFNLCIELFRHGSCLYLNYKENKFKREDIIDIFLDVCLKFGKELDVKI